MFQIFLWFLWVNLHNSCLHMALENLESSWESCSTIHGLVEEENARKLMWVRIKSWAQFNKKNFAFHPIFVTSDFKRIFSIYDGKVHSFWPPRSYLFEFMLIMILKISYFSLATSDATVPWTDGSTLENFIWRGLLSLSGTHLRKKFLASMKKLELSLLYEC